MSGVKLEPAAIHAYPVRVTPAGQQEWYPLDAKAVQALFKAVTEHGLGHPETTLLLETILALPLTPSDRRQLAKAVLNQQCICCGRRHGETESMLWSMRLPISSTPYMGPRMIASWGEAPLQQCRPSYNCGPENLQPLLKLVNRLLWT